MNSIINFIKTLLLTNVGLNSTSEKAVNSKEDCNYSNNYYGDQQCQKVIQR